MTQPRPTCGSLLAVAATLGLALLTPVIALADDDLGDLEELAAWMTGTFSTAVQAAEDSELFDISLHMTPIWPDRTDGFWLYVEQAVNEHPDRPYRQRVYRVRELAPGLFENQVFTLPYPAAVVGAWLAENPLTDLAPGDLTKRDGCAILLRRRGENFIGSTIASLCTSSLRGASYATSEVVVTPEGLISWDRGYAADGIQVWGTTRGGYVFDRIVPDEEEPPPAPAPAPTPAPENGAETEPEAE